jgi:hypothetical protein
VLAEHQSKVNYRMSFRILQFIVLILDTYEKEINADGDGRGKKGCRYPLILPIGLYDGEEDWTAELNFLNKTEPNVPLYAKYIPSFEYMVVDLNKLSREALLQFGDPLSFIMLVDKLRSPEDMGLLSGIPAGYVSSFSSGLTDGRKKVLTDVITGLLMSADVPRVEIDAITNDIQERRYSEMFNRWEGYSVPEARRQLRKEVREELREEFQAKFGEERREWEEKLRQADSQRQQTEAVLQERIRFLEQAAKEQGLKL